jgi:hypothetical protein
VVELSGQLELILPAMIVITIASIISGQLFKNRSVFTMQLDVQGLAYRKPPIEKTLQKIGVLGLMIKKIELTEQASLNTIAGIMLTVDNTIPVVNRTIKKVMKNNKVIEKVNYHWAEFNEDIPLVSIQSTDNASSEKVTSEYQVSEKMTLHQLVPLSHQATLAEAYLALVHVRCGGVYIYQENIDNMIGMVTFEQIRQYLVHGKLIIGVLPAPNDKEEYVFEGKNDS